MLYSNLSFQTGVFSLKFAPYWSFPSNLFLASIAALHAAKCQIHQLSRIYCCQLRPPQLQFLSWEFLSSLLHHREALWFKKQLSVVFAGGWWGVFWVCVFLVVHVFLIYWPSSWYIACRKCAFLYCPGNHWNVLLVNKNQLKLDMTEFLTELIIAVWL